MNNFEISPEWHLSDVTLYQVNIPASEIKESKLYNLDRQIFKQGNQFNLRYTDACEDEGILNIPVGRCADNRCFIHLFGKINGREIKSSSKIGNYSPEEFMVIKDRIKTILFNSKQTFRRYYIESNTKGIREHLTAFLCVF
jgi:hypothetical protein